MFEKTGGPEVLQLKTVPMPCPGTEEVRVRVRACGLNLIDYYLRIEDDPEMPMPHILGSDISGEVHAIGDGVSGWRVGDPVIVSPALERPGDRPLIIGYQTQGGYAEYSVVPARNLLRKPPALSFEEAASLPLTLMTAYHQAYTRGQCRPGDVVLVTGASGGVGSLVIQLCKAAGAFVIGTVSTDQKTERVRLLGSDAVVSHTGEGWPEQVKAIAPGGQVSLVCDNLGGAFLMDSLRTLGHGGRAVAIGSTTGAELQLDIASLFRSELTLMGSYMGNKTELQKALLLVEWCRVKPVVDKVFPLSDAVAAHKYLESRQHVGKIVLSV